MHALKWTLVAGACAVGGLSIAALAQEPPQNTPEQAQRTAGVPSPAQNDANIFRWVKLDCDGIQAAAESAAQKATNADVKSFATRIAEDHKRWCDDHKRYGERVSAYVSPKPNEAVVVKDEGQSRDGRLVYAPTDFVDVKRKVCEHMRKLCTNEMAELKGEEYDRAFCKFAVMSHEAAIASIDAVSGNASTELKTALKDARAGVQKHLDAAKELCKTMTPRAGN